MRHEKFIFSVAVELDAEELVICLNRDTEGWIEIIREADRQAADVDFTRNLRTLVNELWDEVLEEWPEENHND